MMLDNQTTQLILTAAAPKSSQWHSSNPQMEKGDLGDFAFISSRL